MTALGPFLEQAGALRRRAGAHDCCTFPAAWAIACGRPDPMARWRGAYASDDEAEALIAEAGGLASLFAVGMADAGIPEVGRDDLRAGDIGVIRLLEETAGAVFAGKRWAFVPDRGLGFVSLDIECVDRVWRP